MSCSSQLLYGNLHFLKKKMVGGYEGFFCLVQVKYFVEIYIFNVLLVKDYESFLCIVQVKYFMEIKFTFFFWLRIIIYKGLFSFCYY